MLNGECRVDCKCYFFGEALHGSVYAQLTLLLKQISLPRNFPCSLSIAFASSLSFWLKPVMRFMLFHNPHLKGKATLSPRSLGDIALLFRAGINDDNGKGFSQTTFSLRLLSSRVLR